MMRTLVGTLHPDDYADISDGVWAAQQAVKYLHSRGVRIEIPHEHRWWEYGTAVQILLAQYKERMPDIDVLDVGSGWGAVAPTLSLMYDTNVTEYEPWDICRSARDKCNEVLKERGKKGINVHGFALENMPPQDYDAVFCVSVLEHVNVATEKQMWVELGKRVRRNGLFFMTTDCVPVAGRPYTYDNLRTHNFVIEELKERVELMQSIGFTPLGVPDYTYNGCYVHDFTFFRAAMVKNGDV